MAKPSDVMSKHYNAMIKKNANLKEVFPDPPMPALRQPPNLRRILCTSKLQPVQRAQRLQIGTHRSSPGWRKCGKPCHICPSTLPDCIRLWARSRATDMRLSSLLAVIVKTAFTIGNVRKQTVPTTLGVNTLE